MLAKITFELSSEGLSLHLGSLFHGYLMDKIDTDYAKYLHQQGTNPYTSCIFEDYKTKKFYWRITTFNKEAYQQLILPFLEDKPNEIIFEHGDRHIQLNGFQLHTGDYEQLFQNQGKPGKIRLITPTSFKSQGKTHIFPNTVALLQGIINKINTHCDHFVLDDEILIQQLLQKTYLRDYHLRTRNFSLEGIQIKGFLGTMQLWVQNDPSLLALLNFVLSISEYTGFGIKTALGMGAAQYEPFLSQKTDAKNS